MIYCLILNPAFDVVFEVNRFSPGTTYTNLVSTVECAGKAVNVARAISALGDECMVLGIMPQESRSPFERYLDQAGIGSKFFSVPGSARVNTTIVETEGGQTTHFSSLGPRVEGFNADGFMAFLERHARQGSLWALCGSVMPGCGKHIYEATTRLLRKKNCRVFLDSSGDAFRFGVKAKPSMIKPNLSELEEFFGERIRGVHHIALVGKRLLDKGIDYVFVTLGPDGMIALHGSDCLLCSVPQIQALDTVGSGDALVAGLLTGMEKNYSFSEICRLGCACGVSNALHLGAGNVDRNEVSRLMEDVKIRSV